MKQIETLIVSIVLLLAFFWVGYSFVPDRYGIKAVYGESLASGLSISSVVYVVISLVAHKRQEVMKRQFMPLVAAEAFMLVLYFYLAGTWGFNVVAVEKGKIVILISLLSAFTSYVSYRLGGCSFEDDEHTSEKLAVMRTIFALVGLMSVTFAFVSRFGQDERFKEISYIVRLVDISSFAVLGIGDYALGWMGAISRSVFVRKTCCLMSIVLGFLFAVLTLTVSPLNVFLPTLALQEPMVISLLIIQQCDIPRNFLTHDRKAI